MGSYCQIKGCYENYIDFFSGVAVWPLVYLSLRCGDISSALQACQGPGLAEIKGFLPSVSSAEGGDIRLGPHDESKVRMLYKRSVRNSTDPYKRAVYCILGACDPIDEHSEVATSLDDYLWIKLSQVTIIFN